MSLASIILSMPVKFFPGDIITGMAEKVGDHFTAMFLGAPTTFKVVEHHGTFFFGEMVA